ncbi:AMP-binding protein [Bradyrhizobium sp. AUGA SZCCT0283]|uniref:AMP-binding protein n=1 Tax=Bradyrhizobium sp. AUGA SZCCT0283 TaxID=2807671 RepID=UPI001BA5AA56|nr:AMP-binding protein [Bradyrhizobium sp. AUGA SZCCT0283]MBR1279234.1 AMP-binding protein [Bradyrhizobium sp. AUGA SZCCT0283]
MTSERLSSPDSPAKVTGQDSREQDLITVVAALVRELHPQRFRFIDVRPSSRIERDLGIDSLGRTELILRIERAFRVRLPAQTIGEAETVQDLVQALEQARPMQGRTALETRQAPALPSVPAASEAQTLVEVLEWHAAHHPDRLHLTVLQDETTILGTLTYGQLATRARNVARGLIARDILPGDRVALMLPTSIDFFVAFFGILYAGAIPVPIYPPMRLAQIEEHLRRQTGILRNAGARLLITMPEGRRLAGLLRAQVETLNAAESVENLELATAIIGLPQVADPDSIALIQYTSGSTGDPKGVLLSHANLLANIRAMGAVMEASSADIFVSWLPLYHDMGLIGAWLGCLHFGASLYAMSPLSFLVRPESWLWAIHRFRATFSASPNFGFELCLNKIADADLEGLDLSSLRMVANGAEPVSVQTLRRFTDRFGRYGFPAGAMAPVYGLAESSVGLAFPPIGRPPVIDRVDRDRLSLHGQAEPAKPGDPKPLEVVACGQPLPGHEIRIVDEAGYELGERREGRLEFRCPSTTRGYFHNEIKTRELIHNGWIDSADRAYMAGGDVYITGRIKDIIIRAGRHLYPQEIEEAVAGIPGIRKGGVAVFGAADRGSGTERVVVLAETRETDPTKRAALQARAQEVTTDIAGTPPDEVVLAPPSTVPKTSSGKIRRSAAKELYASGHVGPTRRALWWQLLRLAFSGVGPQIRRSGRLAREMLYAAWWWLVLAGAFLLGSFALLVLPRLSWRWSALRGISRGALAAMGVSVSIIGIERIASRRAMLTFNHSSYMDALVLAAVLPGEPAIVAKKELSGQLMAGSLLRRLGIPFVERYDVSGSLTDAEALIALARQDRVLVFFPEGTFTRRAGLSGFYLGAFKVAAEAGLPVLPGTICGTRSLLRSGQWFPRRTAVTVEIGEPVTPSGTDFGSVLRLRDEVRRSILSRCGEPDLGELVKPTAP